jgi:hypothetical protein
MVPPKGMKSMAAGAAAFTAAHAIERVAWNAFNPRFPTPWFLNAGRATALTAAAIFVAALLVAMLVRSEPLTGIAHGISTAVGAMIAMFVVLMFIGPGNLWPIVLMIGSSIVVVSAAAGGILGGLLRRRPAAV